MTEADSKTSKMHRLQDAPGYVEWRKIFLNNPEHLSHRATLSREQSATHKKCTSSLNPLIKAS